MTARPDPEVDRVTGERVIVVLISTGSGVRLRTYDGHHGVFLDCDICGEQTHTVGVMTAEIRSNYHRERHLVLDSNGGPDIGFGGYGWEDPA